MSKTSLKQEDTCHCKTRPSWAPMDDDAVLRWLTVDIGEWEELRQCPDCGSVWLTAWLEEGEAPPILFKPMPPRTKRLRDIDRVATFRPFCLARLEEHFGKLQEQKISCRKVRCTRKRLRGTGYCLEHLIADRFGRHLAHLDNPDETVDEAV